MSRVKKARYVSRCAGHETSRNCPSTHTTKVPVRLFGTTTDLVDYVFVRIVRDGHWIVEDYGYARRCFCCQACQDAYHVETAAPAVGVTTAMVLNNIEGIEIEVRKVVASKLANHVDYLTHALAALREAVVVNGPDVSMEKVRALVSIEMTAFNLVRMARKMTP